MKEELKFKISSALKNIIGSDLINDDFIAVFELVKNAYDAHATRVDVIFENIDEKEKAKIIIKDNGKGMNYEDLINKWLFVAYSAKKEGTEEDSYDYRDKIKIKRAYAGAKGIGRFSCDRLGTNLYLETIKQEDNPKIEALITDWEKFESNITDEFVDISVLHETLTQSSYNVEKGTVLEITNLRSNWDREKLLKLKSALAKLVNPNTKKENDTFIIHINVLSEKIEDEKVEKKGFEKKLPKEAIYNEIVNGDIENLIFEALDLKTTKIVSEVSNKATNIITTTLFEGGKLVYKIEEENTITELEDITFSTYYLNRSAKATFSRRMGMQPVEYGHIFVYKNGLRVYPYGERGEDPLKMDNRKAQGQSRFLGTREVIGYIDIYGINQELRETTSRGDGLIKTDAYNALFDWFYTTLKRLEKYIVEVSDWGKDLSEDDYINLDEHEKVLALQKIITQLTKAKNIISIEYAPDLFQILEEKEENSAKSVLHDIKKKLDSDNFDKKEIIEGIKKAERKIEELGKIKEEAEEGEKIWFDSTEKIKEELAVEQKINKYLHSKKKIISEDAEGLIHHIQLFNVDIKHEIDDLIPKIRKNELSNDQIVEQLLKVKTFTEKIIAVSNLITGAGFNTKEDEQIIDIIAFIRDYIKEYYSFHNSSMLKLNFVEPNKSFYKLISPLELSIVLDNLISNAKKWDAKNITFEIIKIDKKNLEILISDDGLGLSSTLMSNSSQIFELGITETNGAGVGLYYVKNLLKNMKAIISFAGNNVQLKGASFKITFSYE